MTHDRIAYGRTCFALVVSILLVVACDEAGNPVRPTVGAVSTSLPGTDTVGGVGTLGLGSPTPGSDRQDFNFDVSANLSGGRLFYRDWSIVRSDGTVGTLTVDPTDPSTGITAYRDWASACTDPTHGVAFDGTGRLDTGSLTTFTLTPCDNGPSGSGADFLQMDVPPLGYSHGGFLSSGDIAKAGTATVILQDGFENGLSAWTQDPANGRYSVSADPARIHSGTYSLQVLFNTTPSGAYGVLSQWFMPGYDDVYVEFYVLFQEGFQNRRPDGGGMHFLTMCGDNINDQKSCWGKAGVRPSGTDYFYAGVDPEEVNLPNLQPLSFYTYWPDMTCPPLYPAQPCYGNVLTQSSPKVPLVGGQWQQVVFHLKMNTPGQYDGSQELWVNGQQKIVQQNMRWRTTTDLHVNNIRFDDYMDQAPQIEYLWIDDVTVWRQ
ncbi:MAG TPA: hypothetical protein VIV88_17960 [Gemmatimonadales bacterium]|jgi:hypothetical protein